MSNRSVLDLFQTLHSTKSRYIFGGLKDKFDFSGKWLVGLDEPRIPQLPYFRFAL